MVAVRLQVLGTVEGKEGLLAALQEAVGQDSTLALQLKLLSSS